MSDSQCSASRRRIGDEKPRLRVAAERCALPALGERMVRVVDAWSDEELAAALEEAEQLGSAQR